MNKTSFEIKEASKSMLGKQIGRGQCSQVFAWGESTVCKLFYDFMSPSNFENEYQVSITAMSAGLPIPAVHKAVQIENRLGIILDRIKGRDMDIGSITRFWKLEAYVNLFAELQNKIHKVPAPDTLRSQHDVLEEWIGRSAPLPKNLRTAAVSALKGLPEGRQLCHGDYHLGNVLLSQNGPVIIDWQTGYTGNPLGDLAMTEMLLLVPDAPSPLFQIALPFCSKRTEFYRRHYQNTLSFNEEEYRAFLFVAAAARISNVLHNRTSVQHLINFVESHYS